jgi:hypothetical protein
VVAQFKQFICIWEHCSLYLMFFSFFLSFFFCCCSLKKSSERDTTDENSCIMRLHVSPSSAMILHGFLSPSLLLIRSFLQHKTNTIHISVNEVQRTRVVGKKLWPSNEYQIQNAPAVHCWASHFSLFFFFVLHFSSHLQLTTINKRFFFHSPFLACFFLYFIYLFENFVYPPTHICCKSQFMVFTKKKPESNLKLIYKFIKSNFAVVFFVCVLCACSLNTQNTAGTESEKIKARER